MVTILIRQLVADILFFTDSLHKLHNRYENSEHHPKFKLIRWTWILTFQLERQTDRLRTKLVIFLKKYYRKTPIIHWRILFDHIKIFAQPPVQNIDMRKETPNKRPNNKYIGNITISKTPASLLLMTRKSHDSGVFKKYRYVMNILVMKCKLFWHLWEFRNSTLFVKIKKKTFLVDWHKINSFVGDFQAKSYFFFKLILYWYK